MFTCDICLKEFDNEKLYKKHINMKRKCGYICEYCEGFYKSHADFINHTCYIKNVEMLKMLPSTTLNVLSKYNTEIYHMMYGNTDFYMKPPTIKIGKSHDIKLIGGNYDILYADRVICENVNSLDISYADKLSGSINQVIGNVEDDNEAEIKLHICKKNGSIILK